MVLNYDKLQSEIEQLAELSVDILALKKLLFEKTEATKKILAKLRTYKARGIVKKHGLYNYEIIKKG